MSRRRIRNILLKEWQALFTDPNSALLVTLLPLLIVAQALLYIWLAVRFGGQSILASTLFQGTLAKLISLMPALRPLPEEQQLQVLLLNQFEFFLLLIPTMIAVSFATFSIVEEKLSRSLEALLATPVRTWELLLGKALAGAIPALVITWLSGGVFLAGVAWLGWGGLIRYVLTPSWFLSLFLLTPGVALLSFLLGVIGSSRAKDARSAQNISTVIILPVFGLVAVQVTGLVWFTAWLTLALALAIAGLDMLVLRVAVRLFRRESIIIEWR